MRVENGKIVYQGNWVGFSSRPDDFATLGERGVACPIERSAYGT